LTKLLPYPYTKLVKKIFFTLVLFCFFLPLGEKGKVLAATLSLNPGSKSVNVGEPFTVDLKINIPPSEGATSAQGVFDYNKNILEFVSASNGNFFNTVNSRTSYPSDPPGYLNVAAAGTGTGQEKNGNGVLAMVTFTGRAAGNSSLSFKCTSGGAIETGIFRPAGASYTNIVDCNSLANGNYVIAAGAAGTTPTLGPGQGRATCDRCGYCEGGTKSGDWDKCRDCIYPGLTDTLTGHPTPAPGKSWTVLGCLSTTPGGFVQTILQFFITIAGGLAFLGLLAGGATILTSSGEPDKLNTGREIIISSIVGLLLIIFSVFILRLIGFEIFKIPGFS